MRKTAGPKPCAFAEDDIDGFEKRRRRSDARTVPRNTDLTAPESDPWV